MAQSGMVNVTDASPYLSGATSGTAPVYLGNINLSGSVFGNTSTIDLKAILWTLAAGAGVLLIAKKIKSKGGK